MMLSLRRVFAAVAVGAVAMLGTVVGAAPAQAALYDCPRSFFCLYKWINHDGGRWQVNADTYPTGNCWTLTNSTYTTGGTVYDTSASFHENSSRRRTLTIYNWIDCQSGGGSLTIPLGLYEHELNLADINWYHKISSIRIT
ncbi:peptidase inhibitor family I36 protein [Actinoplanes sp. TRM 88003]|uniref:Peptidase inhibitor family I36 protein n=1 Tax=Paractinoplanes aksuensis TaxID=2939490 RepID=A0ABT1DY95_9ACTN|nr:peptidase inhibitor family I36 protein [Actinoplanes aksuensis]MCO8274900.1 peptidase inhibitor family I36 protein [Actinoplanes aksuensis]